MKSVKILKKILKKSDFIVGLVSKARQLKKKLGLTSYPKIRDGEILMYRVKFHYGASSIQRLNML